MLSSQNSQPKYNLRRTQDREQRAAQALRQVKIRTAPASKKDAPLPLQIHKGQPSLSVPSAEVGV